MKNYLLLLFIFFFLQTTAQKNDNHCGSDELHFTTIKGDGNYKLKFDKINNDWQKFAPENLDKWNTEKYKSNVNATPPDVITLTVVFHDMTNSNSYLLPSNASVSGYQYIVDNLNSIYNGTNIGGRPTTNNTFIQFCLATTRSNGDTYTYASTRHTSIYANNLDNNNQNQIMQLVFNSSSQSTANFPSSRYINVYIVDDIVGSVAGFATLPASHGTIMDGIYIERQYLFNNTSLVDNMNVLAHEMGHYLGLLHTFGLCQDPVSGVDPVTGLSYNCACDNNNCLFDGDMVCDTPPNQRQQTGYTALTFPNTCSTDATPHIYLGSNVNPITSDLVDPKENYMDYGFWNLQNRFSLGQIERMNFMIDPIVGPRKSLLGQAACVNCQALNGCNFTIDTNPTGINIITQTGATIPVVQFTAASSCASIFSQVNVNWRLDLLGDTNTTIAQSNASSYTLPNTLVVGNYTLTMTVSLISNSLCLETVVYNFSVIPEAGICPVVLPTANTLNDWSSNNWTRRSLTGGWFLNNSNSYPAGSSQFSNLDSGFDTTGFDIIPITPGSSISGDPILGGINLPSNANITHVMRVGKSTGGGGQAFYAQRTITVNRNNCKFRIWVLGATQGLSSNIVFPFNRSTANNNDAAFGMMSYFRYNSPVNGVFTNYNSNIGYTDTLNSINSTYHNQIISNISNYNLPNSLFPTPLVNGFYRMNAWRAIDLDYSEYVDLNPETEITLTFFSHSNKDNNALQNAYAYFGIECLGGGIPKNYNFDLPDKSISCSSPGTQSCVEYTIPRTQYSLSTIFGSLSSHNFYNIKVYKKDQITGNYSTVPIPITIVNSFNIKICLDQSDAPFQDFRIVCRTFHNTVVDDFRVYIGFYNSISNCTTGDAIDESFHPNLINGDILLCGTDNLPELHLTPTCINVPFTYQWYRKNDNNNLFYEITGATQPTLQLAWNPSTWNHYIFNTQNNYNPFTCNTYIRKVIYREPYCENPREKVSQEFHVYNRQSIRLGFFSATDNDICFGQNYMLNLNVPHLAVSNLVSNNSCTLPAHFANDLTGITNHLTFQMYDPASGQLIGNAINYTFNGVYTNNGQAIPNLNLSFSFNNIDPATGNTPLFVPDANTTSFPVSIRMWGDYLGCPLNGEDYTFPVQYINFSQSAVGGQIAYNCVNNSNIISVDDGVTYGGYGWEYSFDNINFTSIPGETSSTLSASVISSLGTPVYIRRRSNGTGECLLPQYSNVVFLSNHPSSVIFDSTNYPSSICLNGTAPILGEVSSNGILGTWNVATASNQTSGTYIFTPLEGYCLPPFNYSLTVINFVQPVFNQIEPICAGDTFTLPTTSTNGISGSWSPQINNTTTTTYTFTPNSTSTSCNSEVTMTVVVNPSGNVSFANTNLFSPICYGTPAPILPNFDVNGIEGVWSPSVVSNELSGDYTFTPLSPCISPATYTIGVIPSCGFTISWGSEVSCQTADEIKRWELDIADGPCLRVCENSVVSYELHGNLSQIDHTDWFVTGGTLDENNSTDTQCVVTWNSSSICSLQGTIYLTNGTQMIIDKCIEKLEAPTAAFGVYPLPAGEFYTTCVDAPTYFENYSTAAGGNDNLYYNWYFSDGTTSNEFEPVHYFHEPGLYHVTLVVSNGCSCVGQDSGVILVEEGSIEISCPSVVCEGTPTQYTVDSHYLECQDLSWEVDGGTIISPQTNSNLISVIWDNVDQDGFGYVSLTSSSCSHCVSKIKIPVITQVGTIKGDLQVCEKSQSTYSLPQWPSTEFNWTLNDNGTGAVLVLDIQRNEIVVQSQSAGTIDLYCNYTNTLLNCGGTAHITIQVNSSLNVVGPEEACRLTPTDYEIQDHFGNLISNPNWTVTGPQSYSQSGTSNPLSVSFPTAGIYYITSADAFHCSLNPKKVTVSAGPQMPTVINGPTVVCPGIPETYSCNPPSGMTANWSVSNGSIIGSSVGNSILVDFDALATGSYAVNLWYEKDGCLSNTLSLNISRDVPNMDVIEEDNLVCGSSYAEYAINDIGADNYVWEITPPEAGSIVTGQNTSSINVLWNQAAQNATITLEVRKCGALYTITPINVTIINAPLITISGPSEICSGQNAYFDFTQAPAGTFDSVVWDFGDGVTYTSTSSTSASHPYQNPITGSVNYTVTATVSGGNGCLMDSIATFNIIVSPSPEIAISPVTNLNICSPLINPPVDTTYSVTMQGGFASTDTISWYKAGNSNPIQTGQGSSFATIDLQSQGVGTYYATVTNVYTCTTVTQNIVVYEDCVGCIAPQQIDIDVENIGCNGINANVTALPGGYTSLNWIANLPGATNIVTNTNYFSADTILPGEYSISLVATYDVGSQSCTARREKTFIIPYKADLKYQVSCGNNGNYQVTLLDFSTYYPLTSPTIYWFTLDNGNSWTLAPPPSTSGIHQITVNLSPGVHQVGIRIQRANYDYCEKIIALNLPGLPTSSISGNTSVCRDSPLQLTTPNQPNCQFMWNFSNEGTNLQQNPTKTFSTSGIKFITLSVKNQYGCLSPQATHPVNVLDFNMGGNITATPAVVCQGGQKILNFDPSPTSQTPTLYTWYQNTVTSTPYATSTTANLTVTQNGQYLVYLQNGNGCNVYDVLPLTVVFTPLPTTPVISGNGIVCANTPIRLKVPSNSSVIYEWSLNGVLQPQWNNLNSISDTQSNAGIYTYSVIAKVLAGGTTYCSSSAGLFNVTVVAEPNMPELALSMETCDPYQAVVEVTNPQTDVGYYWSNGDTGTSTLMTHDGPLQVRAVINECFVKTQLDLPLDLESMAWVFPKGCYQSCDLPTGYVIGPFGNYDHWSWLEDDVSISTGSGDVPPLYNLLPNSSYSMTLANAYCEETTGSLSISTLDCDKCDYRIEMIDIVCNQIGNQTVYQVTLVINNPTTNTAYTTFSTPNGEGYFSPNTIVMPPGNSTHTLIFNGQVGFNGGGVLVNLIAQNGDKICTQDFEMDFPTDCISVEDCKFEYKIGELNCVKTAYGYIYHIGIEVTNPYAVSATTVLTIPPSLGSISPASVTSPTGITMQHFYFYPNGSFSGGAIPVNVTSGIGNIICEKYFEINLPELCPEVKKCDFDYHIDSMVCQQQSNGLYGYTVVMTISNPYNVPASITMMAQNGEGYFVPSILHLTAAATTTQTFVFYPTNGFTGGDVMVTIEGHYKEDICVTYKKIRFSQLCCSNCRPVDFDDLRMTNTDLLVLAPNPVTDVSTIFYNFATEGGVRRIILTDLLGRTLQEWNNLTEQKGTITVDCSRFAQGNYLILMQHNGEQIKNTKMIKH